MIGDDEETGESGASTQASSPESETVVPQRRKYGHLSGRTTTAPHNRITTPNVALRPQRSVSGGDFHAAIAATRGPYTPPPPPPAIPPRPPQPQSQEDSASDEAKDSECEIAKIVGKRRTGRGIKYKLV